MARPYYSKIAKAWHDATGAEGGPLKKLVLNDLLLDRIGSIDGLSLLEIGAGTGYFARLLSRRRSGQVPSKWILTDVSGALLKIAQQAFRVPGVEYRQMDVRRRFPFEEDEFDLVLASMILNELAPKVLRHTAAEVGRVLGPGGRFLATILHPDFVERLQKNGQLSRLGPHFYTMPGKGSLRVPVVPHRKEAYDRAFEEAGLDFESEPVFATEKILRERPGLRHAQGVPLALVYEAAV